MLQLAGVRRRDLVASVLAGAVTLLSALSLTVLSGWLITRAWEMPPVLDLSVAITAVRALGISRAVFRYVDRLVSHRLALDALTHLRAHVFDAIAGDPTGRAVRADTHVSVVADTERVTDLIVRSLVPRGVALVVSTVAVLAAGWLHPLAGVVLAAGFLVTGVLLPRLAVRAARRARSAETDDTWVLALDEVLDNRVEFEAAGLGEQRARRAGEASARSSRARVAADGPLATVAAVEVLTTGVSAVLFLVIGALTWTGDPTWLGMMVMLPLAAFESHGPLATAAIHADEAARATARLEALLPEGEERASGSGKVTGTDLRVRGLRCAFGDRTWDLEIPAGGRLIIRGPSGCGKTTLLLTLAGLLPRRAGSVELGGTDIDLLDPDALRATVRVHPEDEWLFSTTVRENLRVADPTVPDETMWEVLDAVGLGPWLRGAGGLDLTLDDGAGSLSSGQRRRLLLARALCSDAPVLLLDEPTAHIAAHDAEDLLRLLAEDSLPGPRPDRTVIMVSHQP